MAAWLCPPVTQREELVPPPSLAVRPPPAAASLQKTAMRKAKTAMRKAKTAPGSSREGELPRMRMGKGAQSRD